MRAHTGLQWLGSVMRRTTCVNGLKEEAASLNENEKGDAVGFKLDDT